jgi:hypothetical protein
MQGFGPAPQPAPIQVIENRTVLEAPPPDPKVIAETYVEGSQAVINAVIVPPPIEWANDMLSLPDLWRTTPPDLTYNHPEIVRLLGQMKENAWLLLGLALLAVGISVALARYHGYGGRVVFAIIMASSALFRWQMMIDANNIICNAIGAPDLKGILSPRLTATFSPDEHVGTVVLTAVYAIVALMLMFSLVTRIVLIDVLMVADALASMCWAAPQTEHIAARHLQMSTGLVFSQILIVVGFALVSAFGAVGSGVGGTLLAIAVLLSLRRMPGLLSSISQQQGGTNVIQRVVTRRIVRRVAG